MTFLEGRAFDKNSANLVAVGIGGWVDFWNVHGGGLLGIFMLFYASPPPPHINIFLIFEIVSGK